MIFLQQKRVNCVWQLFPSQVPCRPGQHRTAVVTLSSWLAQHDSVTTRPHPRIGGVGAFFMSCLQPGLYVFAVFADPEWSRLAPGFGFLVPDQGALGQVTPSGQVPPGAVHAALPGIQPLRFWEGQEVFVAPATPMTFVDVIDEVARWRRCVSKDLAVRVHVSIPAAEVNVVAGGLCGAVLS